MKRVGNYVRSKHNIAPIIWDDMLRTISLDAIKRYDFKKIGLEIMVWTYIDGKCLLFFGNLPFFI